MTHQHLKICYFGTYNSAAPRNRIIIKGLRDNGVEVIECHSEAGGYRKYIELIKKHKPIKDSYDLMIVGFPGYKAVLLARFLTRKPVVFDVFVSLYDSVVWDRKEVGPKSMTALYYWLTDWISCAFSTKLLLDTYTHIGYFVREFKIPRDKFIRVLVGSDETVFYPMPESRTQGRPNLFSVHFHGSYIPLQGIEYILEAAKELENENVFFTLIGDGQTKSRMLDYARSLGMANVTFKEKVRYSDINKLLNGSDVALGIFGNTGKAKRVIPNKVYEAAAAGVPIITGDSQAEREVFINGDNIVFCRFADGKDLADKIRLLRGDAGLRAKISKSSRERFLEVATPKKIGETLLPHLVGLAEK